MNLIADFLLASGAFAAAYYCLVLSRRLKRFTALESGMGGAIAVLSAQVDDMTRALAKARAAAEDSAAALENQVLRAESASSRLDMVLASMHDLPTQAVEGDELEQEDEERRIRFVRRRSDRSVQRAVR